MSNKTRRSFTREFKKEAVRLASEPGATCAATACNLGIGENLLRRWREQLSADGAQAFPGHGRSKPEDEEIRRLCAELERTRQERDILKKAEAFFAKDSK